MVICKRDGWKLPVVRRNGHVYIEWAVNIYFKESKIRKNHRHFYHPQPGKLYSIMRKANPERKTPELMNDLERITATCDVFQRESDAPHRFRVTIPDGKCVFNRSVSLDLTKIDVRQSLQIVDKATKFNAACFLDG